MYLLNIEKREKINQVKPLHVKFVFIKPFLI